MTIGTPDVVTAIQMVRNDELDKFVALYEEEIIKDSYWNNWSKAGMFPQDEKYEKRIKVENAYMDDVAIKLGIFDQRCFYNAFAEFDNQDIETSLKSENLIVKIFAVMDRTSW